MQVRFIRYVDCQGRLWFINATSAEFFRPATAFCSLSKMVTFTLPRLDNLESITLIAFIDMVRFF